MNIKGDTMDKDTINQLFESYMECGYDKVTIYLVDGSYHTFELFNTNHRYKMEDKLLRITKCPYTLKWGEKTIKQEITIIIDKIIKIIAKE